MIIEGFGENVTGGKGGEIHRVKDFGEFKTALLLNEPRNIFVCPGTTLDGDLDSIFVDNPHLTILGNGSTLTRTKLLMRTYNFYIEHMRFRPGAETSSATDALGITSQNMTTPVRNFAISNCSFQYGMDELLGIHGNVNNRIQDFTIQWCIFSNCLSDKGSLIKYGVTNGTMHHCLFWHLKSRPPQIGANEGACTFDFRNNIFVVETSTPWGNGLDVNVVGNIGVFPNDKSTMDVLRFSPGDTRKQNCRVYVEDNMIIDRYGVWDTMGFDWVVGKYGQQATQLTQPIFVPPVSTQTTMNAYYTVIEVAGAWPRDPIDQSAIDGLLAQNNILSTDVLAKTY